MKVLVASAISASLAASALAGLSVSSEARHGGNWGDFSEEGYRHTASEIKPPYKAEEGIREALVTQAKVAEIPPIRVMLYPPTPVPTQMPTFAQGRPANSPLPADLTQLVSTYFPGEVGIALRVMLCESGGNPKAHGSAGERGLMQIHPVHASAKGIVGRMGYTWDDMYLPEPNLAVAAALLESVGGRWRPTWSCG